MNTLFFILIVFDLSIITRAFYDYLFANKDLDYSFVTALFGILSSLVFDIIPVTLILLFHTLNFKEIYIDQNNDVKLDDESMSQQSDNDD